MVMLTDPLNSIQSIVFFVFFILLLDTFVKLQFPVNTNPKSKQEQQKKSEKLKKQNKQRKTDNLEEEDQEKDNDEPNLEKQLKIEELKKENLAVMLEIKLENEVKYQSTIREEQEDLEIYKQKVKCRTDFLRKKFLRVQEQQAEEEIQQYTKKKQEKLLEKQEQQKQNSMLNLSNQQPKNTQSFNLDNNNNQSKNAQQNSNSLSSRNYHTPSPHQHIQNYLNFQNGVQPSPANNDNNNTLNLSKTIINSSFFSSGNPNQSQKKKIVLPMYYQDMVSIYNLLKKSVMDHNLQKKSFKEIKDFVSSDSLCEDLEKNSIKFIEFLKKPEQNKKNIKKLIIIDLIESLDNFLSKCQHVPIDITLDENRKTLTKLNAKHNIVKIHEIGFSLLYIMHKGENLIYDCVLGFLSQHLDQMINGGQTNKSLGKNQAIIQLFCFLTCFDIRNRGGNYQIKKSKSINEQIFDEKPLIETLYILEQVKYTEQYSYEIMQIYFYFLIHSQNFLIEAKSNFPDQLQLYYYINKFCSKKLLPYLKKESEKVANPDMKKMAQHNIEDFEKKIEVYKTFIDIEDSKFDDEDIEDFLYDHDPIEFIQLTPK